MKCLHCGQDLKENAKFCSRCGTAHTASPARFCTTCGIKLKPGARFCSACGSVQRERIPRASATSASAPSTAAAISVQNEPHTTIASPKQVVSEKETTKPEKPQPFYRERKFVRAAISSVLAFAILLNALFFREPILRFFGLGMTAEKEKRILMRTLEEEGVTIVPEYRTTPCEGVEIYAPEGALDQERTFHVQPMEPEELLQLVADFADPSAPIVQAYHFDSGLSEGEHYNSDVSVTLDLNQTEIPKELHPFVDVYHISDSGVATRLPKEFDSGKVTVKTVENCVLVVTLGTTLGAGAFTLIRHGSRIKPLLAYDSNKSRFFQQHALDPFGDDVRIADLGRYTFYWPSELKPANPEAFKEISETIEKLTEDTIPLMQEKLVESGSRGLAAGKVDKEDAKELLNEYYNDLYTLYLEQKQILEKAADIDWVFSNLYPTSVGDICKCVREADRYLFTERGFKPPNHINVVMRGKYKITKKEDGTLEGKAEEVVPEQKSKELFFDQQIHLPVSHLEGAIHESDPGIPLTQSAKYMNELDNLLVTVCHELFHVSQEMYIGESFWGDSVKHLWFKEATAVALQHEAEQYYKKTNAHPIYPNSKDLRYTEAKVDNSYTINALMIPMNGKIANENNDFLMRQGYASSLFIEYLRDKYCKGHEDSFLNYLWTLYRVNNCNSFQSLNYEVASYKLGRIPNKKEREDMNYLREEYLDFAKAIRTEMNTYMVRSCNPVSEDMQKGKNGEWYENQFIKRGVTFKEDGRAVWTFQENLGPLSFPALIMAFKMKPIPPELREHHILPRLVVYTVGSDPEYLNLEGQFFKNIADAVEKGNSNVITPQGARKDRMILDLKPEYIGSWGETDRREWAGRFVLSNVVNVPKEKPCQYVAFAIYPPPKPTATIQKGAGSSGEDQLQVQIPAHTELGNHVGWGEVFSDIFYVVHVSKGEDKLIFRAKAGETLKLPLYENGLVKVDNEENRQRMVDALRSYVADDAEQWKTMAGDLYPNENLSPEQMEKKMEEAVEFAAGMMDLSDLENMEKAARILRGDTSSHQEVEVRLQEFVEVQKTKKETDVYSSPVGYPTILEHGSEIGSEKTMLGKWQGKPFGVNAKVTMTFSESTLPDYDYDIYVESTDNDLYPTSDQGSELLDLHYVGKELGDNKVQIGYWTEEFRRNSPGGEIRVYEFAILIKTSDNECYQAAPPINLKRVP